MLFLEVKGGTKNKRDMVFDAAWFAFDYLMPHAKKPVEVEIKFSNLKGVEGLQMEVDDREFEIEVHRTLAGDDLLTCIFHEMVHVVQDLRKTKTIEMEKLPYWDRPFEIEAYELQEIILKEYQKST